MRSRQALVNFDFIGDNLCYLVTELTHRTLSRNLLTEVRRTRNTRAVSFRSRLNEMGDAVGGKNGKALVQISTEPERDDEYRGPFYELHSREIRFPDAVKAESKRLRSSLLHYMLESRFFLWGSVRH